MKHAWLLTGLVGILVSCAEPPHTKLVKAAPLEKEVKTEYVEIPSPRPLPGQLKPLPRGKHSSKPVVAKKDNSKEPSTITLAEKAASEPTIEETLQSLSPTSSDVVPRDVIAEANIKASVGPEEEGFVNSIMEYDYMEGALYQLYAAPQHVTSIMLQSGERLLSVASGDTVRWVMNDIKSGAGDNQRVHVLVKPVKSGLATNLLITTDRHIYHIEAHSDVETYMASLSWRYPQDTLMHSQEVAQEDTGKANKVESHVQLSALHFGYKIEGKSLAWKPERVFDDGLKTYIEFPESLKAYEAPVLFISTPSHATQLVNYRKKGDFYIVDRLFNKAELRVGEKDQDIVTIRRIKRV